MTFTILSWLEINFLVILGRSLQKFEIFNVCFLGIEWTVILKYIQSHTGVLHVVKVLINKYKEVWDESRSKLYIPMTVLDIWTDPAGVILLLDT